jgi:hypothetical protein
VDWVLCSHTLRSSTAFRDPLELPDLPTCRRLNVTTNMVADWLGGWKNRNPGCVCL